MTVLLDADRLPNLVQQHESGLVPDLKFVAEADCADAFRRFCEESDSNQNVAVRQLTAGERRIGSWRKLTLASLVRALPLAPRGYEVRIRCVAPGADRLAIIVGEPDRDVLGKCLLVGQASDALNTERACLFREKKMLRLCLRCESCSRGRMQIL